MWFGDHGCTPGGELVMRVFKRKVLCAPVLGHRCAVTEDRRSEFSVRWSSY